MLEEILPGLFRIEIPLPGSPLKSTNSYVLTSAKRNLVIDTGFNLKECREAMEKGFGVLGIDLEKTDFFSTHFHADHQGLIPIFIRNNAKAYMGAIDAERIDQKSNRWRKMREYGAMSGFPVHTLKAEVDNHPAGKNAWGRSVEWTHAREGDTLSVGDYELICVETPGHTWGHVCLYDARHKLFFSGDHILGDITPNIQVWEKDDDPLSSYIHSLEKTEKLDIALTLPGHRSLISDCYARIRELKQHCLERCDEVLDILHKGSRNAYQTASEMTWNIDAVCWEDFPLLQRWFATGEAFAHLRFLEKKGLASETAASDGVIHYASVKGDFRLRAGDDPELHAIELDPGRGG